MAESNALWSVLADKIDREVLEAGTNLKVVSNLAVGYNNIDVEAAKEHGIVVTNTPGVLTETTAIFAFALLLATARRITEAENELRKGNWTSWTAMGFTGMDVGGATIGVIGMGRIGEAVARRGKGFDMRVLYNNRSRKPEAEAEHGFEYAELDDLLKESDFVVILAPYTPETVGLIGERELGLMKNTAVLINVARGGIIDESALYTALKEGKSGQLDSMFSKWNQSHSTIHYFPFRMLLYFRTSEVLELIRVCDDDYECKSDNRLLKDRNLRIVSFNSF